MGEKLNLYQFMDTALLDYLVYLVVRIHIFIERRLHVHIV